MTNAVFPEGNYRTTATVLSTTNETVVYTTPVGFVAFIVFVNIADDAGEARTATVLWRDESVTTTYTLVYQKVVAINVAVEISPGPLVLEAGDTLRVTASASGVHVTVTALEFARH